MDTTEIKSQEDFFSHPVDSRPSIRWRDESINKGGICNLKQDNQVIP